MAVTVSPIRLTVREIREAKGMTQLELAERAGIRRATVSEIEGGATTRIDLGVLERLANALDVDASLLIRHDRGRK